jgi:hypothetical protein
MFVSIKATFKSLFLAALFLCSLFSFSQSKTIDDILAISLKSNGIVSSNNKLVGYFYFYTVQKLDYDNSEYLIKIFDLNLNEILSEKLVEYRNIYLKEVAFDNEVMLLKFYSHSFKDGGDKYYLLNKSKKIQKLGFKPSENTKEGYSFSSFVNTSENSNRSLFDIHSNGFVSISPDKKYSDAPPYVLPNSGYVIDRIDSKGNKIWNYESKDNPEGKGMTSAHFLINSKEKLYCLEQFTESQTIFKAQFGNKITQSIAAFDIETGKKLLTTKLVDDKYSYQVLNCKEIVSDKSLQIIGLYFNLNDRLDAEKPNGLFIANLDNRGKLIDKKYILINDALAPFLSLPYYKEQTLIKALVFQNIFQTKDDKIYAIAQNCWLKGSTFMSQDIFVLEIDADFKISKVKVFDKPLFSYSFISGYGTYGIYKVANLIGQSRISDYLFTQFDKDSADFMLVFKNIDNLKDIKRSIFIPSLVQTEKQYSLQTLFHTGNEYFSDNLKLNFEEGNLYPAKALFGSIMLMSYNEALKKIELRIEKFNY